MPVHAQIPGFCVLGYPAQLKCPGLLYLVVGIHVTALELVFKLVYLVDLKFELAFELIFKLGMLLGPEVGLLKLLYFIIPGFKPIMLMYLTLIVFELSMLMLGLPMFVCLTTVMFELLWLISLLVGPSFKLSKLMYNMVFSPLCVCTMLCHILCHRMRHIHTWLNEIHITSALNPLAASKPHPTTTEIIYTGDNGCHIIAAASVHMSI